LKTKSAESESALSRIIGDIVRNIIVENARSWVLNAKCDIRGFGRFEADRQFNAVMRRDDGTHKSKAREQLEINRRDFMVLSAA